jgi:hypothetical protein
VAKPESRLGFFPATLRQKNDCGGQRTVAIAFDERIAERLTLIPVVDFPQQIQCFDDVGP